MNHSIMKTKRTILVFMSWLTICCGALAQNMVTLETVYQKKAFELFSEVLAGTSDNVCFSPLSVQVVMSMVQNGANNNTLRQMQEALGTTGYSNDEVNAFNQQLCKVLTYRPPFTYNPKGWYTEEEQRTIYETYYPICEMANGIWTRPGTVWHERFLQIMNDIYEAGVGNIDFTTQEGIDELNEWFNMKTHGLIPKVYDEPLSEDLAMLLANALFFKGSWAIPFDKTLTKAGAFHCSDGTTVETDMMRTSGELYTSTTEKFRTVHLLYGNGDFSMTVFVPIEGIDLPALTYEDWEKANKREEITYTDLQMPSFVVEDKYELNDVLKRMGMVEAFDSFAADFSNMYDRMLWIGRVFQCSKIAVDEKGTAAAAVTVVEMYDKAMPDEPKPFVIDRPFYFTIEHRPTSSVLFTGRVTQLQGTASILQVTDTQQHDAIYDLQGRQLTTTPQKGIYIRNGKKYVAH